MSNLADEIERQLNAQSLTAIEVAKRSNISPAQLSKWVRSEQTSISKEQLDALAPALSRDLQNQASLVRAHLLDEKYGPGSELVDVVLIGKGALQDRPANQSKAEKAMTFLMEERLTNRDLNELLIDLAKVLGAELDTKPGASYRKRTGQVRYPIPARRKVSSSPKMDTDHKIATALREGTSGQKPGGGTLPEVKK